MCNRVKRPTVKDADLADEYDVHDYMDEHPEAFADYGDEAVPTNYVAIVLQDGHQRVVRKASWWFIPSWSKTGKPDKHATFNARSEKIGQPKSLFHSSFKNRRCLVPVAGFVEYEEGQSRVKTQHLITVPDLPVFSLAGLWNHWKPTAAKLNDPTARQDAFDCFTVVTTEANEVVRPFNDRMPVLIPREHYARWLDPENDNIESLYDLLVPFPASRMRAAGKPRDPSTSPPAKKKKNAAPPTTSQGELF